ncbi:putative nucleic acid binding protein [Salvia divinorum RNA virus 1]|uniref:putative nucleic acid binding protein n=1 Tax=Salvia divinorum RNA virus 1 TaxID=2419804 RepID=UPI000EB63DAC|nr:putative nucleic acid binding protein [Salvia divinorum RNA virus 1]AYE54587.1 putative nucleic acid binding protein [Salvia divinorum RNA virus 1]
MSRSKEVRKIDRQKEQRVKFGEGTSRSSAKRRAKWLKRCVKCGRSEHIGECKKIGQRCPDEFLTIIRAGPNRSLTEKLLNPRGLAFDRALEYKGFLEDERKRLGYLTIKDPNSEHEMEDK